MLVAGFKLHAHGVNPAHTLSDISGALSRCLSGTSGKFEDIAKSFGNVFNSASDLLGDVAQSEKIHLSLNANIDIEVRLDLSLAEVQLTSTIKELSASFVASISDSYDISIEDFSFHVEPHVELHLQTENTATPFDLFQNPSDLTELSFGGYFSGLVLVGMEGVPVEISVRALSQDITNTSSLEFDLSLDLDLVPIKDGEYNHPSVIFSIQLCVGSNTFLF